MADITTIPIIGFARGSVVKKKTGGPNMLVVRGLDDRTVVVVCESDEAGTLRLRDYKTADLMQVLAAETPSAQADYDARIIAALEAVQQPEVAKLIADAVAAEKSLWVRAIETYFDAISVEDVEFYVAQARVEAATIRDGHKPKVK